LSLARGFENPIGRKATTAYRLNSATFGSAINTPFIPKSNPERMDFVACSPSWIVFTNYAKKLPTPYRSFLPLNANAA
jgi:hypothetical protein